MDDPKLKSNCLWCGISLIGRRPDTKYCCRFHKQNALKKRVRSTAEGRRIQSSYGSNSIVRKHGISPEEKAWLVYKYQNGICPICLEKIEVKGSHIDHDHTCTKHSNLRFGCKCCIRGALHSNCNYHVISQLEKLPHLQNELVKSYLARRPFWKFEEPNQET